MTVFDASLGKNCLFFRRAAVVVARVDRLPEVEPSPGSASGGGARAAKVAREKPPLRAVTAALRVRLGIASDLSARASGKISDRPDAAVVSREFASTDDLTV